MATRSRSSDEVQNLRRVPAPPSSTHSEESVDYPSLYQWGISSAISSAVLLLTCYFVYYRFPKSVAGGTFIPGYLLTKIGICMGAVSSIIGIIRYSCNGIVIIPRFIITLHSFIVRNTITTGLAFAASDFMYFTEIDKHVLYSNALAFFGILSLAIHLFLRDDHVRSVVLETVSAVSAISLAISCWQQDKFFGCVGSACIIWAIAVVGVNGRKFGMPAVDLFMYVFSLGMCLMSLTIKTSNILAKKS